MALTTPKKKPSNGITSNGGNNGSTTNSSSSSSSGLKKRKKAHEASSPSTTSPPTTTGGPKTKTPTKKNSKQQKQKDTSSSTTATTTSIQKPQISVQVHRFRNANYIPRSILKLCATPRPHPTTASTTDDNDERRNTNTIVPHLAISREGGSVELVSIDEKWKCVGIVEGLKKRNVDAMAWLCPSLSSTSTLTTNNNYNTNTTMVTTTTSLITDDDPAVLISDESESNSNSSVIVNTNYNDNVNDDINDDIIGTSTNQYYFNRNHQLVEQIQAKRRLFGASRDGTIFEIDFKTKTHVGVIGSGGGAVFCLETLLNNGVTSNSSSSSSSSMGGDLLAAGCEDGSVRIFKSLDRQKMKMNASGNIPSLELISTLPSAGCAVTSIVWIPPPQSAQSSSSLAGSILYAGVADGTIRKFTLSSTMQDPNGKATNSITHATSTGMMLTNSATTTTSHQQSSPFAGLQWKASARLTVENQGKRIATKIWSLRALGDGTLVSGDSMGNIQFWDGHSGTLMQSIPHNKNDADVLDIAVSLDQRKIMASGIDSRVVCLEYDSSSQTSKKWIISTQQRSHTHDVNSLAMVYMTDSTGCLAGQDPSVPKKNSGFRELLCSGGVDTKICSYLVSNMRKHRPKIAYKYPSNAPIVLSKKLRMMSIMRPDRVDMYQLRQKIPDNEVAGGAIALDEEKAHLGSVRISSNHNLISFDVNNDGTLLAASHAAGMYVFSLEYFERFEDGDDDEEISRMIVKPTRIDIPMALNSSCSSLRFSKKDSNLLVCAHCNGTINVLKVNQDLDDNVHSISLEHSFKDEGNHKRFSQRYPITHLDVSLDGQWIAVGRNSIGKGCLNVYSLSPPYRHWWTLPCTEAPFACIKFVGDGIANSTLAVSLNNSIFYLFDIERRCLSDWSQDLGFPASPNLPKELSQCKDCPDRLAFNPFTPNKFLMGGPTWFCSIDLDAPVPQKSKPYPPDHFKAKHWGRIEKKRPRSNSSIDENQSNKRQKRLGGKAEIDSRNFTICLRYSGMIFLEFLDDNELVVVEQPWLGIVNSLPNALERHRYGS